MHILKEQIFFGFDWKTHWCIKRWRFIFFTHWKGFNILTWKSTKWQTKRAVRLNFISSIIRLLNFKTLIYKLICKIIYMYSSGIFLFQWSKTAFWTLLMHINFIFNEKGTERGDNVSVLFLFPVERNAIRLLSPVIFVLSQSWSEYAPKLISLAQEDVEISLFLFPLFYCECSKYLVRDYNLWAMKAKLTSKIIIVKRTFNPLRSDWLPAANIYQ